MITYATMHIQESNQLSCFKTFIFSRSHDKSWVTWAILLSQNVTSVKDRINTNHNYRNIHNFFTCFNVKWVMWHWVWRSRDNFYCHINVTWQSRDNHVTWLDDLENFSKLKKWNGDFGDFRRPRFLSMNIY